MVSSLGLGIVKEERVIIDNIAYPITYPIIHNTKYPIDMGGNSYTLSLETQYL